MRKKFFIRAMTALLLLTEDTAAQEYWNNINLAGAEAKILSFSSRNDRGQTAALTGRVFETEAGKIKVYLPPLNNSVTISGTVYLEPNGRTERETRRNLLALQDFRLQLNTENLPLQTAAFTTRLSTGGGNSSASLALSNSNGQLLQQELLPLSNTVPATAVFSLPPYIITAKATGIPGNFDGNSSNTQVNIGGSIVPVIAESPSVVYFSPPPGTTGKQTITLTENTVSNEGTTHILDLQMQAGKTNLRKGQQTTLTLQVSGLEGLKESVPLLIQNLSPSVIAVEGGNLQTILIHPATDAASGVYTLTRTVQSTSSGGFSVSATIQPPARSSRR